ncbi:MAG: LON peptidase substrate-binding domain-containing protein [Nitrospirales bacterium]
MEPSCSTTEPSSCLFPDRIPLFPLPNIVFFPRTHLPLHIFEPRYRQMVIDVTTAGNCIGMALFKEGWQENYYGNPAIYGLGCMGRIVSIQNLADGRSNIMLRGLCRYKILEEEYDRAPYRQARIAPVLEEASEPLTRQVRADLLAILHESLAHRDSDQAWEGLESELSDEVLVNILSASLDFTPLEKQLLLEADTVRQRARRLSDLLQFKRYERDDRKGRG